MSVYTHLTTLQLKQLLSHYALGELVSFTGIKAGITNSNYIVTTCMGQYVLTIFEELTVAEVPVYLQLTQHLADKGICAPKTMTDKQGQMVREINAKPLAFIEFLKGVTLQSVTEIQCVEVAQLLAKMHNANEDFRGEFTNHRDMDWHDNMTNKILSQINQKDKDLLSEELAFAKQLDGSQLSCGVIHGDLFLDNMLFDDGSISAVIDFYYACRDYYLMDLAIVINDLCFNEHGFNQTYYNAICGCYRAHRKVSEQEWQLFPALLRRAALRFWLSRMHDKIFTHSGGLVTIKDPDAFKRVILHHRQSD